MLKITVKNKHFVLELPANDAVPVENLPDLKALKSELNMNTKSVFSTVFTIANDQKDSRINPYNPTGDFVRFFDGTKEYEVNPYLVSELYDANGVLMNKSLVSYYSTLDLVNCFETNFF